MICYIEKDHDNYDNEIMVTYHYELEETDTEEIVDQLLERYSKGQYKGKTPIFMINPFTDEEIELHIHIEDYIPDIEKRLQCDNLK